MTDGFDPYARAWLQRPPTDVEAERKPDPDEWAMTLEHHGGATNHAGDFNELVALARLEGVDDFRVWSTTINEFEAFTSASVRPLV